MAHQFRSRLEYRNYMDQPPLTVTLVAREEGEKWQLLDSPRKGGFYVLYDYRAPDGVGFACEAPTLDECRKMRDEWLSSR